MILKYGARPLRRTIQNEIEDALAEQILIGKSPRQGNRVKSNCKRRISLHFTSKKRNE